MLNVSSIDPVREYSRYHACTSGIFPDESGEECSAVSDFNDNENLWLDPRPYALLKEKTERWFSQKDKPVPLWAYYWAIPDNTVQIDLIRPIKGGNFTTTWLTNIVAGRKTGVEILLPQHDAMQKARSDVDFMCDWEDYVSEQIQLASLCKGVGLYGSLCYTVAVGMDKDMKLSITSFVRHTIERGAEKNKFFAIIQSAKDPRTSWRIGKDHFFANHDDRFEEGNWDGVLSELLGDLAKVVTHHVPALGGGFGIGVRKGSQSITTKSPFTIRFFGRDLTAFGSREERKTVEETKKMSDPEIDEIVHKLVKKYVDTIVEIEFTGTRVFWRSLADGLIERYCPVVFQMVKEGIADL